MSLVRKTLLGVATTAAAGGLMLGSATAATAASEPPPGNGAASVDSHDQVETKKVWKNTWRNAETYHWSSPAGGVLYAGSNYFYCQQKGSTHEVGKYKNNW